MTTFTSSLPNHIIQQLSAAAKKMNLPKNKLIENALKIYLDQLKRAEYVKSYKEAGANKEIMLIAEEGMKDYLSQLSENETR